MAKKKKCRPKYISKGERRSISKSTVRLVREDRTELEKIENKLSAWRSGKKGFVTIANPIDDPSKRFIKVSFDAYFGKGRDFKTVKFGEKSNQNRNEL